MKRIVVIVGHARPSTYCEALGESYLRGAKVGGHDARLFVTSKMTFDPILHEGFSKIQQLEADLKTAHDAMLAADHLVLISRFGLGHCLRFSKAFLKGLATRPG
jgi:NAD(P)H dehydrogenase (quinone)